MRALVVSLLASFVLPGIAVAGPESAPPSSAPVAADAAVLVSRGAKVRAKNRAGETPLSLAKARKDAALIQLLTTKP